EMVSNYLEHVLLQKKYLPRAVRGNWHSYVKEICKTAPIVREHVERYKTQYSKTLRRVIGCGTRSTTVRDAVVDTPALTPSETLRPTFPTPKPTLAHRRSSPRMSEGLQMVNKF